MKRVSLIAALLFLLAAPGCQHPTEVEVRPDPDRLEVTPLVVRDTATYLNELDSTGVTPDDQQRFTGFMLVSRVTFDAGSAVVTKSFSKVVFTEGRLGLDLRVPLTINGAPMMPAPHRIRMPGGGMPIPSGTEYVRELPPLTGPDTVYTWRAGAYALGAIDFSIQAPPAIKVSSPAGGTVLRRDQDLRLRWNGSGDIRIFVSALDNPPSWHTRPLLKLTPAVNRGQALVPAKFLRALPPFRYFVFTFVVANRKEGVPVGQYGGSVLAQAATVYNSYVEFR